MAAEFIVEICDWTPEWAAEFRVRAAALRQALGEWALRIDHIGSTSVEGLAAKPIVDIQVSIAEFEPMDALVQAMAAAGYVWRADNPELTKRYFRETAGAKRCHVHIRLAGAWNEQWALLFRDYLRTHPAAAADYEAVKRALAAEHAHDRHTYTEAKADFLWATIREADAWAGEVGWRPRVSDG
ncbi:MAG TPA: GrpB family protein [Caulobacteraceae bacterium]|nr:GrpB family protein [Caulobacteraceae bacterium]